MTDAELIARHGGPASLARKLGLDPEGGTQRVHNWTTRGIPPRVKLERPDLFLGDQALPEPAPQAQAQGE